MSPAAGAAKTVLIADDTAFVRDRFKAALEEAGHRAITVRTAAELLARAEVVESKYGLPARRWARALTRHAVDGVLHF